MSAQSNTLGRPKRQLRRARRSKEARNKLALIKMGRLLAKNKKMKLHTAAGRASRHTTGASPDAIARRLVKHFEIVVYKYFKTRLNIDPEFIIIVDDEFTLPDSFDTLLWRGEFLEKTIEEITKLLAFRRQRIERDAEQLQAETDEWQLLVVGLTPLLPDYSHTDRISVTRDTADLLARIRDLREDGVPTDVAVDIVGRHRIERNAQQLRRILEEIKQQAHQISRRQRDSKEISDLDFVIDMILLNNFAFFDAFFDAFFKETKLKLYNR
jgi:hypothetical protein